MVLIIACSILTVLLVEDLSRESCLLANDLGESNVVCLIRGGFNNPVPWPPVTEQEVEREL